jgi:pimeloyl-ACP methyl ester carboxylesterase
VLACTSPAFGNADGDFQKRFVGDRIGPLDAGKTMADLAPALVQRMIGPAAAPAGSAYAVQIMSAVPPPTYRAAVRCLVTFDERASLSGIRVPVLCLAGEADQTAPAKVMERMAARIPGARFASLPGAGHLPNLETPDAFDDAILEFLRQALTPIR